MAKALFILIFLCLAGSQLDAAQPKMSLKQCYDYALRRSETVAISAEEINIAKARYTQALGQMLPQVNILASEFLQDDSAQGNTQTPAGNVANTFTRFSRPEVAVNVYQNLFQGFKEFTALRLSKTEQVRDRFLTEDLERLLYKDVATAFYLIAAIELDINTTLKEITSVRSRLKELNDRVKLGKSRESEPLTQEADLSLLEAGLEEKRGNLKVAYEMMSFLTGLDPQPPIDWRDSRAEKLEPLEAYTAVAEGRPDVKASRKAVEIAKGDIKVKRADLFPNANAQVNFYPYRVGFQKDIHWDATFNLNIPVFNWSTYGVIREAKVRAKQSQISAELTKRTAVNEIERAYAAFQSSLNQLKKYNVAASKAEASYRKQIEEFGLGLINNLDVLQSQRTFFSAVRLRNDARVKTWADSVALRIIAGMKP